MPSTTAAASGPSTCSTRAIGRPWRSRSGRRSPVPAWSGSSTTSSRSTAGRPACVDNGPELTAETFVDWCAAQRIAIGYIQPGKPDQNAFIERFNRSFREEVLDAYLFDSLEQVREITEAWLEIYNTERPHDRLGPVPPLAFLPRPDGVSKSTFAVST